MDIVASSRGRLSLPGLFLWAGMLCTSVACHDRNRELSERASPIVSSELPVRKSSDSGSRLKESTVTFDLLRAGPRSVPGHRVDIAVINSGQVAVFDAQDSAVTIFKMIGNNISPVHRIDGMGWSSRSLLTGWSNSSDFAVIDLATRTAFVFDSSFSLVDSVVVGIDKRLPVRIENVAGGAALLLAVFREKEVTDGLHFRRIIDIVLQNSTGATRVLASGVRGARELGPITAPGVVDGSSDSGGVILRWPTKARYSVRAVAGSQSVYIITGDDSLTVRDLWGRHRASWRIPDPGAVLSVRSGTSFLASEIRTLGLLADAEGNAWVELPDTTSEGAPIWALVAPTGVLTREVELPKRCKLMSVEHGWAVCKMISDRRGSARFLFLSLEEIAGRRD